MKIAQFLYQNVCMTATLFFTLMVNIQFNLYHAGKRLSRILAHFVTSSLFNILPEKKNSSFAFTDLSIFIQKTVNFPYFMRKCGKINFQKRGTIFTLPQTFNMFIIFFSFSSCHIA